MLAIPLPDSDYIGASLSLRRGNRKRITKNSPFSLGRNRLGDRKGKRKVTIGIERVTKKRFFVGIEYAIKKKFIMIEVISNKESDKN